MRAVRHSELARFAERARPFLEANEAENNLMLGLLAESETLAVQIEVEEAGRTVAVALRSGGRFPLALSRAPESALQAIAEMLDGDGVALESVVGPTPAGEQFARRWEVLRGVEARVGRRQRIHACDRVIEPAPVEGRMRAAGERDRALLDEWAVAFARDAGVPAENARERCEQAMRRGTLRLWETDQPVSMACSVGATANGVRVAFVYTPPERRGRGYASHVTAALTAELLASGRRFAFLYTDLSNPTSNKIYSSIGYRPVCDADEWRFQTR
jgi:predicted GNAT family acetyltransferase